ncbi:MAG TPA: phenylalanine--tRNA ligase subunit beta [Candidatus Polarisedimenticolia bacterium]|nr:phenylalanine--tRNA ligase subunit beta [Candidatus Polarisedimenticolia bacterium]
MRFSHDWLRDYVDLPDDPDAIGRKLTSVGLPLEAVEGTPGTPGGVVYDLDVFSNRPDCMNHLGVARELAAIYGVPLRRPAPGLKAAGPKTADHVAIEIADPERCRRYAARCVLGVRVGPSPAWLKERLERLGHRSINNVVDATNFVLWDIGQPLHPFDLDRVAEHRIVVRPARAGEALVTLDGVVRRLSPEVLVIADPRSALALAGIMGGQSSEIRAGTANVLLESAWFDPVTVRRGAKGLGMHTDASHRFERGADPEAILPALDRAAALIAELAGGKVTDPPLDVRSGSAEARRVSLRPARAAALLDHDPGRARMREILERLEFRVETDTPGSLVAVVPSFRRDIEREVDLIEEVARHAGYDAIPSRLPAVENAEGGRPRRLKRLDAARLSLLQVGFTEAVNFDLAEAEESRLFEPDVRPLAIENPLQSQAASLRTTLLPGLLRNVAHNLNRGLQAVRLFEVGSVFHSGPKGPVELSRAAAVVAGLSPASHWSTGRREADLFDARGAAEALLSAMEGSRARLASDRIASGAALAGPAIEADGRACGRVGEIDPAVLRRFEIDRPVFAFELDLQAWLDAPAASRTFRPLPRVPSVRRDLALVVPDRMTIDQLEAAMRRASPLPIAAIEVFDRYRGKGVPPGHASVALQLVFQAERTLEAEAVQKAIEAIVAEAERQGARLRGTAHES